jgi:hypothetical protein
MPYTYKKKTCNYSLSKMIDGEYEQVKQTIYLKGIGRYLTLCGIKTNFEYKRASDHLRNFDEYYFSGKDKYKLVKV